MRALLTPFAAALVAVLAYAAPALAYVERGSIDFVDLLPPPPAAGSPEDKADVDAVLAYQEKRTPATVERAQADVQMTIFRFADVLGPDFSAEKLPTTAAFFAKVKMDSAGPTEDAKAFWNRPRPHVVDPAIKPVVELPKNAAYPSGHTTFIRLNAIVLATMVPEKRREIFARADEYADNRIVAGVHYPTDIAAGKIAGTLLAAKELESPQFKTDFEAAKAELRSVLKLTPTQ